MHPPQFPNQAVAYPQAPTQAQPQYQAAPQGYQAQVPVQSAPQGYPGPAVPVNVPPPGGFVPGQAPAPQYAPQGALAHPAYGQPPAQPQYGTAPVAPTYPQGFVPGQVMAPAYPQAPTTPTYGAPNLAQLQAEIAAATLGAERNPTLPVGTHFVRILGFTVPANSPGLQVREYELLHTDSPEARIGAKYARLQGLNGGGKNAAASLAMQKGIILGVCLACEGFTTKDEAAAAGQLEGVARRAAEIMAHAQGMPVPMPAGGPYVGRIVGIRVTAGNGIDPKTGTPYTNEHMFPAAQQ